MDQQGLLPESPPFRTCWTASQSPWMGVPFAPWKVAPGPVPSPRCPLQSPAGLQSSQQSCEAMKNYNPLHLASGRGQTPALGTSLTPPSAPRARLTGATPHVKRQAIATQGQVAQMAQVTRCPGVRGWCPSEGTGLS